MFDESADVTSRESGRVVCLAFVIALIALAAISGTASAHQWQDTVEKDQYRLGINSNPERPVAGVETTFVAAIGPTETVSDGHSGDLTDQPVTVDIVGPDGSHTHMTTQIPADDPHFTFAHTFLTNGTYELTVTTTADGEPTSFTTTREVQLLPTTAPGGEVTALRDEVASLRQSLRTTQLLAGIAAFFAVTSTGVSVFFHLRGLR
ncbi:hypothetical protein [Salinigranum halophilum]|uniref:hypothetical protein n=1 Tax=Salinigranum halophilum TaxID=2565931 RepID=UPI00115D50E4|nr:hypothetical protein [Salinigranum halophilum]